MTTEQPTGPAGTPRAAAGGTGAAGTGAGAPDGIRADMDRTRAELGDSVEALAARADIKARARQAAATARIRATDKVSTGARVMRRRAGALAGTTAESAQRVRAATPQRARQVGEAVRRRPAPAAGIGVGVAAAVAAAVLIGRRRAADRVDTAGVPDEIGLAIELDRPEPAATIDELAATGEVMTLARLTARAATIRAADRATAGAQVLSRWAGEVARRAADAAQRAGVAAPPPVRLAVQTAGGRSTAVAWTAGGIALVLATIVLIRRRRAANTATAGHAVPDAAAVAGTVEPGEIRADVGPSGMDVADSSATRAGNPDMRARARRVGEAVRRRPAPVAATAAGVAAAVATVVVIGRRRTLKAPAATRRWLQ